MQEEGGGEEEEGGGHESPQILRSVLVEDGEERPGWENSEHSWREYSWDWEERVEEKEPEEEHPADESPSHACHNREEDPPRPPYPAPIPSE